MEPINSGSWEDSPTVKACSRGEGGDGGTQNSMLNPRWVNQMGKREKITPKWMIRDLSRLLSK